MTKRELRRLFFLTNKMWVLVMGLPFEERHFKAVLEEVGKHLERVNKDPAKWGVK